MVTRFGFSRWAASAAHTRSRFTALLWRWTLRRARLALDVADEWIHAQEVRLREQAAIPQRLAEVDPIASAVRERAVLAARQNNDKAQRKLNRMAVGVKPMRLPRLRYEAGQFVRRPS